MRPLHPLSSKGRTTPIGVLEAPFYLKRMGANSFGKFLWLEPVLPQKCSLQILFKGILLSPLLGLHMNKGFKVLNFQSLLCKSWYRTSVWSVISIVIGLQQTLPQEPPVTVIYKGQLIKVHLRHNVPWKSSHRPKALLLLTHVPLRYLGSQCIHCPEQTALFIYFSWALLLLLPQSCNALPFPISESHRYLTFQVFLQCHPCLEASPQSSHLNSPLLPARSHSTVFLPLCSPNVTSLGIILANRSMWLPPSPEGELCKRQRR